MPAEQGYTPQVGPAQAAPLPQAGPGAFGAGVGDAVVGLSDAVHRASIQSYQIDQQQKTDTQATAFNARYAQLRSDADRAAIDAQNNPNVAIGDHAATMAAWWDKQQAGLLDGITDTRLRRSAQNQLQQFGAEFKENAYHWQVGAQIGQNIANTQSMINTVALRTRTSTDPDAAKQEYTLARQSIDNLSAPPDVREKLYRELDQSIAGAHIQGMVDRGQGAAAVQLLDGGHLNDILTDEQFQRLRREAETGVRQQEAQARAQAALQNHADEQAAATTRATLDTGAGTPQNWFDLATTYDRLGKPTQAVEARAKGTGMQAALTYRGDTLGQMDARLEELNGKQAAGGMTPPEASEQAGLAALRSQTAERLKQPGGVLKQFAYASGQSLAPIDVNNPTSMRQRAQLASAASARYGRADVQPLLDSELPQFRALYDQGANGKLQVLHELRGLGDPRAIDGAARQIAEGDDGQFRVAATLGDSVARDILRGDQTIKSVPQVWDEKVASHDFAGWYGDVLSQMGGSVRDDVFKAARAFYVQRASDGGITAYNPGKFAEAVETVLGRVQGGGAPTGGVAHYGGRLVMVPRGVSAGTMQQTFARAAPGDYQRASGGQHPVWADGHPMTEAEFKTTLPTMMANGRYGFRSRDGGYVRAKSGGAYSVDYGQLHQ